jgi:HSP20 family protein
MQHDFFYKTHRSVYPGEYVPLFKEDVLKKPIRHSHKKNTNSLPVNMKELGNSYKIELAIPGVSRENLLLKAHGKVLSISVIQNNKEFDKQENFQLHEFDFNYSCTRKLSLPGNADTVFAMAEYKAGILHLYIPKSTEPLKLINANIAVY